MPLEDASTHFVVVGAVGSGKTVTIRALMQAVLPNLGGPSCRGALVYDAKHDLLPVLAGMGLTVDDSHVVLLDPFDRRSSAWDIAADITDEDVAFEVATVLCPAKEWSASPYYNHVSREIVAQIMWSLIEGAPGQWTLRDVVLGASSDWHLRLVLGQTRRGRQFLEEHGTIPNLWSNIRASLADAVRPYHAIAGLWHQAASRVSLRAWSQGEMVLVLGSNQRARQALSAINLVLFQRLTRMTLDRDESHGDLCWCFLDDVVDAGHLEGLGPLLSRGRSRGVCLVLGCQDLESLRAVYGESEALAMLAQCQQRAVLRAASAHTAQWATSLFGVGGVAYGRPRSARTWPWSRKRSPREQWEGLSGVSSSALLELPVPDAGHGPGGVYSTPRLGTYHARLRWDELVLPVPRKDVAAYLPRPDTHQVLEQWTDDDLRRLRLPRDDPRDSA